MSGDGDAVGGDDSDEGNEGREMKEVKRGGGGVSVRVLPLPDATDETEKTGEETGEETRKEMGEEKGETLLINAAAIDRDRAALSAPSAPSGAPRRLVSQPFVDGTAEEVVKQYLDADERNNRFFLAKLTVRTHHNRPFITPFIAVYAPMYTRFYTCISP